MYSNGDVASKVFAYLLILFFFALVFATGITVLDQWGAQTYSVFIVIRNVMYAYGCSEILQMRHWVGLALVFFGFTAYITQIWANFLDECENHPKMKGESFETEDDDDKILYNDYMSVPTEPKHE